MDKDYEIIIEPCYIIYAREHHTALIRLHTLWQDYRSDWNNGDMQMVTQAWHGIMALVAIFRERNEWDEDKKEPKPFFKTPDGITHKIECPHCWCNCTWDDSAWEDWDGDCPCCGEIIDPLKKPVF